MKKIVSLFLSVVMLFGTLVPAFSAQADYFDDTYDDFYYQYHQHEHNWRESEHYTYDDCDYGENVVYVCTYCGEEKYENRPLQHQVVNENMPATQNSNGYTRSYCVLCGKSLSDESITRQDSVELSSSSFNYDGKAKCPKVTVYDYWGDVISNSNYSVSYKNNVKAGKATAVVTFNDVLYSGTLTQDYFIKPKANKMSSVKYNSKGKITAKWSKNTTAKGYILQYSTSSKFVEKNTCTIIISKNSTTSKSITNLPAKKYYVRVAPYITDSGNKYRAKWSNVKSVTVKKGVSFKTMINATKTTTNGRAKIKKLTNNGVDIAKYKTTYDRIKAIYNWHAKHYKDFAHCLACNASFNDCLFALYDNQKAYDSFLWIGCDRFKNRDGSVVQHKWAVVYLQGVPYIFDPRLQGYTGNYTGDLYFGIPSSSSIAKKYLFDGWYESWKTDKYYTIK